jgi:CHAT domain-containing protein
MSGAIRVVFIVSFCILFAASTKITEASDASAAAGHRKLMEASIKSGDHTQALLSGVEAERLFKENGNVVEQIKVRIQLSTAYQNLGQYRKGLESLKIASDLAGKAADAALVPPLMGHMGNAFILLDRLEEAEPYLKKAIELADEVNDLDSKASALNYLGNLYVLRMSYDKAGAAYRECIALSEKTNNRLLAARAMANSARALFQSGNLRDAENQLNSAYEGHLGLADSHDKAYGLINIAQIYRQLSLGSSIPRPDLKSLASTGMRKAAAVAEGINDHLSASYSFGYLGRINEDDGRYHDALNLTRRAIFEAQQVNSPEVLYLWQWQSGRLFRAEGRLDEALAAYRNAVSTLQSIRQELLADCKIYNGLSFQDKVTPIYFELADLLLKRADSVSDHSVVQGYYTEARQTIEMLKAAELQDYFQDACIAASGLAMKGLEAVSSNTAVIYVVPLPDRLELLMGLASEIKRFTVKIDAETFTKEVRLFRKRLEKRTTRQYLPHARRLYEWLIRPLETELASRNIETLVFVPHGPLRTVPMAALHDGRDFLISKFAVATTPGLSLTEPRSIQAREKEVLLAGLTEPVQGFPALINVPMELKTIQELYKSSLLRDSDFRISLLKEKLEQYPYPIVHIASHAEFFENSRDTYILTWDEKLKMEDLERIMGISRFRREPVELLCLSACVTAADGDRAALGLAGVAVRAGARSALASLWYINDHTSYELVTEFYRRLKNTPLSKAAALQKAQIKLINDRNSLHPGYWSPFLLIGNWL